MIKAIRFEDLLEQSESDKISFEELIKKETIGKALDVDESLLDPTGKLFVFDNVCPFDVRG